ncbi:MAG: hypothetical protein LC627_04900, partial [Verrucomicrobiaceae bacterium]|nr:hypothetical protein [Verrucomicrobiaceae bacterium]
GVFRFVGLLLFVSGSLLTWGVRTNAAIPGGVGVASAKQLASIANRGRNFEEAISLSNRALQWAPLDWQLYFLRAIGEIGARRAGVALDDFRRARFLEPNAYEVPLEEGNVWVTSRPLLAVTAWREALRRAGRERAEVYGHMLTTAALRNQEVARMLEDLGLSQHDLAMAYLSRVSGDQFTRALARFRENDPDLQTLTPPEKFALFALWSERGDLDELTRVVEQHPEWTEFAWQGIAKQKAKEGNFREAYELTRKHGDQVAVPRVTEAGSIEQLQKSFYAAPNNYGTGYALYRAQMKAGRVDDALITVRRYTEQPNAPAYFRFLEAEAWAAKENWERAWTAWEAFQLARTKTPPQ